MTLTDEGANRTGSGEVQELKRGFTKHPYAKIILAEKKQKIMDGSIRIYTDTRLCFNSGAVDKFGLKNGDRVGLMYDRHNDIWDMPVLIVSIISRDKAPSKSTIHAKGAPRSISRTLSGESAGRWLSTGISSAVRQWDLPIIYKRKLEILDYVDSLLIYIDVSGESSVRDTARLSLVKKNKQRKELMIEKLSYTIGGGGGSGSKSHVFKTTASMKAALRKVARLEGKSVNKVIINALQWYIDKYHSDLDLI